MYIIYYIKDTAGEGDFQAAIILICVIRDLLEEDIMHFLKSWHAEGLSSLYKKKKSVPQHCQLCKKSAGVVLSEMLSDFFPLLIYWILQRLRSLG